MVGSPFRAIPTIVTIDQSLLLVIAFATLLSFLWGRWRHDMIAIAALLACVVAGLVNAEAAFAGFGHPAVVTVASVLVLSRGLLLSGAVDRLVPRLLPSNAGPTLTIASLTALGAVLSAFMNNVGALALLMPIAMSLALKRNLPPGTVLMPLAFGSILGGMTTLIGTPPNLIVSGFRAESGLGPFGVFAFTPVGLAVAAAGVAFVALVGWRLVPRRERGDATSFDLGAYLTEVRISDDSKTVGKTIREIEGPLQDADAHLVGLVRNEMRMTAPNVGRVLQAGDILVIEADPDSLRAVLSNLGLELVEDIRRDATRAPDEAPAESAVPEAAAASARAPDASSVDAGEIQLLELAVLPNSTLIGRSASGLRLRTRFGLNLLAISRQGRQSIRRLRSTPVQAGDVLLMQGAADALAGFASEFGCVPLAPRAIHIPAPGRAAVATGLMAVAIGSAAVGLVPASVAFVGGVLAFLATGIVPLRSAYDAVDWPVVVLLGALMPVAGAMQTTGTADLITSLMLTSVVRGSPVVALVTLLVMTMTLSDFMNNAATTAIMAPLAFSTSAQLGANPDTFLMAVAIGASCAFLTPIGHQNSTLILGPGGFRFGDYWRLGLPLELIVVGVSVPMLLWVWPL